MTTLLVITSLVGIMPAFIKENEVEIVELNIGLNHHPLNLNYEAFNLTNLLEKKK